MIRDDPCDIQPIPRTGPRPTPLASWAAPSAASRRTSGSRSRSNGHGGRTVAGRFCRSVRRAPIASSGIESDIWTDRRRRARRPKSWETLDSRAAVTLPGDLGATAQVSPLARINPGRAIGWAAGPGLAADGSAPIPAPFSSTRAASWSPGSQAASSTGSPETALVKRDGHSLARMAQVFARAGTRADSPHADGDTAAALARATDTRA